MIAEKHLWLQFGEQSHRIIQNHQTFLEIQVWGSAANSNVRILEKFKVFKSLEDCGC